MLSIPQAVRCFELSPCSELRFDLRWHSAASFQQQLPVLTVKLEPRDPNTPVVADWFGFSSTTNKSNTPAENNTNLTYRIGCTRQPSSLCLFSPSGCFATVEGPSLIVQKAIHLFNFADFDRHQLSSSSSTISLGTNQTSNNNNNWPLWRKQVLQFHEFLHSQRLAAAERGRQSYDNILNRIGPRVMVCSSRAGSGKTTICKMLLNYAVRDGFEPLFISADPTGTSICGQPGCFSACFADQGVDPTEGFASSQASLYPTMQVVLPLEGASRSKRAEPWKFAIEKLIDITEKRTLARPSCASGGIIVDTETVDEFLSPDDLDKLVSVIDVCGIDYVIVMGSENLRNSLRLRLAGTLNSSSDSSDAAKNEEKRAISNMMTMLGGGNNSNPQFLSSSALDEQVKRLTTVPSIHGTDIVRVARNEGDMMKNSSSSNQDGANHDDDDAPEITLINFPTVEGAEDYQFLRVTGSSADAEINANKICRAGLSALQSAWYSYFFGSATSPLSAFYINKIPVLDSKWCIIKSATSSDGGGVMPLLGAGEEQKTFFKASAEPIDIVQKFQQHRQALERYATAKRRQQQQQQVQGAKPSNLMVVAILRHHTVYESDLVTEAEVMGFVGVVNVITPQSNNNSDSADANDDRNYVDLLCPVKSLPREPHVFALLHSSCQPY